MVLRAMIRPQQLKRSHLKIPDKKTPSNKLRHRFLSSQSTSSTLAASKPSATLSPVECRRVPNLYPSDGTGTCHDDHARRQIQCAVYCYTALAIPPIRSAASCAVPPALRYNVNIAPLQSYEWSMAPRRTPKLHPESALFQEVRHCLEEVWLPQQITNILRTMLPAVSDKTVNHKTIYNTIYLHPRGELKCELIACLRHHNQIRKPRSRGVDSRGQSKDMQSIHIRPPQSRTISFPATGKEPNQG